jgi:hypothetical protein
MKINITESQFYNLIPPEIKRRIESGDMEIIDKIVESKYRGKAYWTYAENFEDYLNSVIEDSIDYFVFNKEWETENGEWMKKRNEMRKIFQNLTPYLKKKYYYKARKYYKTMRS